MIPALRELVPWEMMLQLFLYVSLSRSLSLPFSAHLVFYLFLIQSSLFLPFPPFLQVVSFEASYGARPEELAPHAFSAPPLVSAAPPYVVGTPPQVLGAPPPVIGAPPPVIGAPPARQPSVLRK